MRISDWSSDVCSSDLEVILDQPGPDAYLAFRRPGVAVARQVYEHQPPAEVEEIDLPRPARGVRGARECLAPGQRVDEARLADIRTARSEERRVGQEDVSE